MLPDSNIALYFDIQGSLYCIYFSWQFNVYIFIVLIVTLNFGGDCHCAKKSRNKLCV